MTRTDGRGCIGYQFGLRPAGPGCDERYQRRDASSQLKGCSARGEEGQVGGVEGMVFGVLIFMLGVLVVANAWGVIDAKMAAAGAAREAVRAYIQAPSITQADSMARQAAIGAIRAEGRDDRRMTLIMSGPLVRCGRVTAVVRYRVPLVAVPILGGAGAGLVASARQSALVDPYRNGLAGTAPCG